MSPNKKICAECGETRPSAAFEKLRNRPIVRDTVCIPCREPGTQAEDLVGLAAQCKERREAKEDRVTARELAAKRRRESKARVKAKEQKAKLALQNNDAAKELARRELARRALLQYILRFNPDYLPGWVHEDICRRLERFLEDVRAGKDPRVMLFMPPRHGKSTIASVEFPSWILGKYPELEVMACSYGVSLPVKFSRQVRERLRDLEYGQIFEGTRVDPESQNVEGWSTTAKGGYIPAGVGGGITGKGADVLIVDDPFKDARLRAENG